MRICKSCRVEKRETEFYGGRRHCKPCYNKAVHQRDLALRNGAHPKRGTYHVKVRFTPEYRAWMAMRSRCNDKNCRVYKHYGGRGIKCLFDTFASFLACIGPRPSPELSVDRIDNNGHYEPGNVRWATQKQQVNNSRRWEGHERRSASV